MLNTTECNSRGIVADSWPHKRQNIKSNLTSEFSTAIMILTGTNSMKTVKP